MSKREKQIPGDSPNRTDMPEHCDSKPKFAGNTFAVILVNVVDAN
jgi:hypothetical protein